mmetsp:Transcript_17580/g.37187  ORF Transcript_17580/g.37187 Transcript_17580/m.37187 type:complete len:220 (+) Transcript_17580:940-1599(+)
MSVKSHCSRWNARLTDACSYALKSRAASRHSHVRTFAACHAACVATRRTARATSASEAAATAAVAASMAAASREACVSTSRRVLAACHDAESVSWPMARAVVAPRNEESSRWTATHAARCFSALHPLLRQRLSAANHAACHASLLIAAVSRCACSKHETSAVEPVPSRAPQAAGRSKPHISSFSRLDEPRGPGVRNASVISQPGAARFTLLEPPGFLNM